MAEFGGILTDFDQAWMEGYKKVIVDSDFQTLVATLNSIKLEVKHSIFGCLTSLASWPWQLEVMYIPRNGNKYVDFLANSSLASNSFGTRVLLTL